MKTKSTIAAEQSTTPANMAAAAPDGVDYRVTGTECHYREQTSREQPFDIGSRFFIPGMSYPSTHTLYVGLSVTYNFGPIQIGGANVAYWSSTAPLQYTSYAYSLFTGTGTHVEVERGERARKFPVMTFE